MRKRILKKICVLAGVAILSLTSSIAVFNVNSYSVLADANSDFEIEGGTLTGYKGKGGAVVIPNGVTRINEYAFQDCSQITSLFIPKSVEEIDWLSFIGCDNLERITVDSENPVYDSRNKCNAIIKTESNALVLGCKNTSIPSGVEYIGGFAFYKRNGLTSIIIPDSVTEIGSQAFDECSSLTGITIPGSVTIIGFASFRNCKNLKNLTISNDVKNISNWAFAGCSSLTELVIPDSVEYINEGAFCGCSGLTNVSLSSNITFINYAAFQGCSKVTNIIIPSKVTQIGDSAFKDCTELTNINLNNNIEYIGAHTFSGCSKLSKLFLPLSLKSVGLSWEMYYSSFDSTLTDIYYAGSKDELEAIRGYTYNFANKTIHYNYTGASSIFNDVFDWKWYSNSILYVYKRGAMTGKSEGVFDPLANIQRSETIAMLYKLEGSPAVDTSKSLFPDVTTKNWYNAATIWGKTKGIINGISSGPDAGKFMPKDSITRQDFTKILYEYAKYKGYDVSVKSDTSYKAVADSGKISSYAIPCMNWGYEKKLIANNSDFKPKDKITRREAAVILARFLELYDYQ